MKKVLSLMSLFIISGIVLLVTNCETDPKESCNKDELCPGKSVTLCCTDNDCVYEYDGKEYSDSQEGQDQLSIDLGCTDATLKSYNKDIEAIKNKLQALLEKTRKARQ